MKSNIYISRKVLNYQDIRSWAKDSGFDKMLPEDSLHITVVFCKHKVDWNTVPRNQPEMLFIDNDTADERAVHDFNGGACVLEIKSDELLDRNEALRDLGIYSKFPDYRAHITITYEKPDGLEVDGLLPYRGPVILGPEIIKAASLNWKNETKEIDLQVEEADREMVAEWRIDGFDANALYETFRSSLDEPSKPSISRETFLERAVGWNLFGDTSGFVATTGGADTRKIVGMAGSLSGVMEGLQQIAQSNQAVWGMMSRNMANKAPAYGFIAPHALPGANTIISAMLEDVGPKVGRMLKKGGPDNDQCLVASRDYFRGLAERTTDPLAKELIRVVSRK